MAVFFLRIGTNQLAGQAKFLPVPLTFGGSGDYLVGVCDRRRVLKALGPNWGSVDLNGDSTFPWDARTSTTPAGPTGHSLAGGGSMGWRYRA